MPKKKSASSARGKPQEMSAKRTKIDFSDIPESTAKELAGARRVGRPVTGNAKQLIALRISPKLLTRLRQLAKARKKPYQTLMHELLEAAVKKDAA